MELEAAIVAYYPADEMTDDQVAEDLVRRIREMWDGAVDVEVGHVDGTTNMFTVRISSGVVDSRAHTGLGVCDVLVVTRGDGSTVVVGPFGGRDDCEMWMAQMGLDVDGHLRKEGWSVVRRPMVHPMMKRTVDYLHGEGG